MAGALGVSGDAFIFKLEPAPTGSGGAQQYLHKDEEFVLTGGESMVWGRVLRNLYYDLKRDGKLEAEGITSQIYCSP